MKAAYAIGTLRYSKDEGAAMLTSVYTASENADSLTITDRSDCCRVTLTEATGDDYEAALLNLLAEVRERGRLLGPTWARIYLSLKEHFATQLPDVWRRYCKETS